jgi:hypothetical protein
LPKFSTQVEHAAFDAALRDRVRSLLHTADRAAGDLADDTAERMRSDVPRLTGETADSIHVVNTGEGEREIHLGGASLFLIFGTSKMAPRDFARPAIAEAPRRFRPPSW